MRDIGWRQAGNAPGQGIAPLTPGRPASHRENDWLTRQYCGSVPPIKGRYTRNATCGGSFIASYKRRTSQAFASTISAIPMPACSCHPVPLLYVSQQLGHTNPTTTLRYYARWIPTGDQRYVDLLDMAAEKSWHQTLAPEVNHDRKSLILGTIHHRRPMMMNQQPLVPDPLEEICR